MAPMTACYLHAGSGSGRPAAAYMILLPIGNQVALCRPCLDWWLDSVATSAEAVPVKVWSIRVT